MAYQKEKVRNNLQLKINYGADESGTVVKRTKTYNDLNMDETVATPEAIVLTAKAMGSLMTPLVESVYNVMTYDNMDVA